MTLSEFLLARIAEDEKPAKDCVATGLLGFMDVTVDKGTRDHDGRTTVLCGSDTAFLASCDPHRVLAECEAKREIVYLYDQFGADGEVRQPQKTILGVVCRVLASVYSGHPDYREEWRP